MNFFEATMLICFGVSWPVSIAKALRTKEVAGKSPWFMILISLGYTSGIIHKAINNPNWVIFLYALNLVMVLIDLSLYLRYSRSKGKRGRQGA